MKKADAYRKPPMMINAENCLPGVPPDAVLGGNFTMLEDKVILIVDKPTALRMLQSCRDPRSLPS